MTDDPYRKLSRKEASDAVTSLGWRLVLGELRTQVLTGSLPLAADVAARAAAVPGADGHLRLDIRADRVILALQSSDVAWVTSRDVELARKLSAMVDEFRLHTDAQVGADGGVDAEADVGTDGDEGGVAGAGGGVETRAVQVLEIGIDALDAAAIRPFWRAVLGYDDEPGAAGGLVDPLGQGPAVWFQQMDAPRPQRNRIHLDVSVPHDEAPARIAATLAAGGTISYDAEAPAFWVLADAEGNEACITTWQGRDR
jgi:4a-hydroxytetrahydrobiopterin dehydratase